MKQNLFLKSLVAAVCLLGGIFLLVEYGTTDLFFGFVIVLIVLLTTSMIYGLFDDNGGPRY